MARRPGRKPNPNVPDYLRDKLPKKETEEHRQMRAYWLSMPAELRSYAAVAKAFNCERQKIASAAKAFNWEQDAEKRDSSIIDPFYEKHQEEIDQVRLNFFRYFCTALQKELKRQSFEMVDSDIVEKIKAGDMEGATKEWSVKDWTDFVKNNIRANGYKDILHIIEGIQKVVFEWNPNKYMSTANKEITIPGNNNKILIFDN